MRTRLEQPNPAGPRTRVSRPVRLAVLVGTVLAVLAVWLVRTAVVVESGLILPDVSIPFHRVRLPGGVEILVAREELRPMDMVNGLLLALGAGMAAMAALVLGRVGTGAGRLVWMAVALAAGLGFLALDEQLSGHETIGYTIEQYVDVPLVHTAEDAVFAGYALPAGFFLLVFRRELLAARAGAVLVGLGMALFLAAAALDVLDRFFDEQLVEVASTATLVAGFAVVLLHHIGRVLGRAGGGADAPLATRDDRELRGATA